MQPVHLSFQLMMYLTIFETGTVASGINEDFIFQAESPLKRCLHSFIQLDHLLVASCLSALLLIQPVGRDQDAILLIHRGLA